MAEVSAVEREAKAEAAFGTGFGDTPPAAMPPVKVVPEPAPEPAKPVAVVPAPAPEKPQYIRLTKQEWDNTKAAAGKVSTLESQLAKLTGSIPKAEQIVQQAIEKIQAQTPAGQPVELTDDDFAEWTDFPEVGATMRKSMEKIVKRLNVRGTAAPAGAAVLDSDAIDKAVDARLKARDDAATAATREKEMTGLAEVYPDWGKIVGQPLAMGTKEPVETEWRKWATTNDHAALTTDSPAEVKASIEKFMESQKPAGTKPDKAAARRAVIADAVTPRTEGNPPPLNQPMSAEEAFGSGFKAVKAH